MRYYTRVRASRPGSMFSLQDHRVRVRVIELSQVSKPKRSLTIPPPAWYAAASRHYFQTNNYITRPKRALIPEYHGVTLYFQAKTEPRARLQLHGLRGHIENAALATFDLTSSDNISHPRGFESPLHTRQPVRRHLVIRHHHA